MYSNVCAIFLPERLRMSEKSSTFAPDLNFIAF